jgi:L-rhamnose isomerase
MTATTEAAYAVAREQYAALGVDTERAIARLGARHLSLPCWQGDDVRGFEHRDGQTGGGGIQATGAYPGRARTPDELRADLEAALRLIPGRHRVNLHAMYGEFGDRVVDRDAFDAEHYAGWMDWAADRSVALDFNATLFAHPRAADGFTLSSRDEGVRAFWIAHVRRCRHIAAAIGRAQGSACLHDLWIPDGMKDTCVDRAGYRARLRDALDEVYAEPLRPEMMRDAAEGKLFGIGSESFVVGSHEFYLGYCLTTGIIPCLDMGHYHPTESVADKLSAILLYADEVLLHLSRGVRWDSDHVVVLDDAVRDVAAEIVRAGAWDRVHLALDSFDASINRVGAWVVGARAVQKALLVALLEPHAQLLAAEAAGDYLGRLALLETARALPFGAVWAMFCARHDVPSDDAWTAELQAYERAVLRMR